MPGKIFHQNLQNFAGSDWGLQKSLELNKAYDNAFRISDRRILVAGFTEVMGANLSCQLLLKDLGRSLMRHKGVLDLRLIQVGLTAVGAKKEYVGILVQHGFQPEWWGMTYQTALDARVWGATAVPDDPHRTVIGFPKYLTAADTRGFAFVGGVDRTKPNDPRRMLVGFMHNVFTISNRSYLEALDTMVEEARKACGDGYEDAAVIIGGDFNVDASDRRIGRGDQELTSIYAKTLGRPINTTSVHCYDYWFQYFPRDWPVTLVASVWGKTLKTRPGDALSDHAAITLDMNWR